MAIFNRDYIKEYLRENAERDRLSKEIGNHQRVVKSINTRIGKLEDKEFHPESNSREIRRKIEKLQDTKNNRYNKMDKLAGEIKKIDQKEIDKMHKEIGK